MEYLPNDAIINFLVKLDYQSIINYCKSSRQGSKFCNNWYFWALKAELDFYFPRRYFDKTSLENPRQRYLQIRDCYNNFQNCIYYASIIGDTDLSSYALENLYGNIIRDY